MLEDLPDGAEISPFNDLNKMPDTGSTWRLFKVFA